MISRNERLLQSKVAKLQHRVKALESETLQLRARLSLGDYPEVTPPVPNWQTVPASTYYPGYVPPHIPPNYPGTTTEVTWTSPVTTTGSTIRFGKNAL